MPFQQATQRGESGSRRRTSQQWSLLSGQSPSSPLARWSKGLFASCAYAGLSLIVTATLTDPVVVAALPQGPGPVVATPTERVAAHLAAGEFGPAIDQAAAAPDAALQATLLQKVAAAQQQSGVPAAARGTLRRIPQAEARAQALAAQTRQQSLAGGGAMADFGSLMLLIQENTNGQWEAVDGDGGTMTPFFTGVRVAPNAIIDRVTTQDNTGNLSKLADQVRKADLNADMAQASPLRVVSLRRLEQQVAQRIADGLVVPESMAQLAGLSQVQYVFLDTDHKDILIAGPAEAWQYSLRGQPVGVKSGRPTLQLDDLVTVLRTFAAPQADFGCSINTRDEGVRSLQAFAAASLAKGPLSAGGGVRNWVNQLQKKLGPQDVVVWGVPHESRVARVIVEADYRMKLIGIEKLEGGKSIPSYFELLAQAPQKNPPNMEALRWWLTMKYDAVAHSPDRAAFEIQGSSVLCQSENQHLTAEGKHVPSGMSEPINRAFAENFTRHYAELAQRDPVFADLQNVFDLALVAALVHQEQLARRADLPLAAFAPKGLFQTAKFAVPREIDSVVNHKVYNGKDVVVQVAGGVRGDLVSVVKNPQATPEAPALAAIATVARSAATATPSVNAKPTAVTTTAGAGVAAAPSIPAGRWWWDAAR